MNATMTQFLHVTEARWLSGYRIQISFNNGDSGIVDLEQELDGPVFGPLRDLKFFASFSLDGYTLSWPNGADFAPEFLHSILR